MEKRVVIYQTQGPDFYAIMGPYFAHRKYAQEMGGWQFYTKDSSVWFLLFVENKLAGFNSIIREKTHLFLDNFYMIPQFRGKGLSGVLFDTRLEFAKKLGMEIRLICDNPIQITRYKKYGFEHYGFRGRYHKFRMI